MLQFDVKHLKPNEVCLTVDDVTLMCILLDRMISTGLLPQQWRPNHDPDRLIGQVKSIQDEVDEDGNARQVLKIVYELNEPVKPQLRLVNSVNQKDT